MSRLRFALLAVLYLIIIPTFAFQVVSPILWSLALWYVLIFAMLGVNLTFRAYEINLKSIFKKVFA